EDPKREDVEQVRKAAEGATALTRQLLAFSRQQVLEPKVVSMSAVVSGVEKMLRRVIGEDVDLATRLDPDVGSVKADVGQLEQVLMNLAVNARDAMPTGGKLTIETGNAEHDPDYAREHEATAVRRFVMLAVSVNGIVKQSGGFIWVYSEPGRGTTFKIYLPRVDAPAEAGAAATPGDLPRGTETVLIVEDAAPVRAVMRHVLERQGYAVLEASNGAAALELVAGHPGPIHLLLTDVLMPGLSGRQLADRPTALRSDPRVRH